MSKHVYSIRPGRDWVYCERCGMIRNADKETECRGGDMLQTQLGKLLCEAAEEYASIELNRQAGDASAKKAADAARARLKERAMDYAARTLQVMSGRWSDFGELADLRMELDELKGARRSAESTEFYEKSKLYILGEGADPNGESP